MPKWAPPGILRPSWGGAPPVAPPPDPPTRSWLARVARVSLVHPAGPHLCQLRETREYPQGKGAGLGSFYRLVSIGTLMVNVGQPVSPRSVLPAEEMDPGPA